MRNMDYVMAAESTYVGPEGVGKGCLLGTSELLLLVPEEVTTGTDRVLTTRVWTLRGSDPASMLEGFLSEPAHGFPDLRAVMLEIASSVRGAVLIDLACARRLKVRSGLLGRGIYVSLTERGPSWKGFPLSRADAPAFVEFYRGHPALVGRPERNGR
jgi:hypothetical protein